MGKFKTFAIMDRGREGLSPAIKPFFQILFFFNHVEPFLDSLLPKHVLHLVWVLLNSWGEWIWILVGSQNSQNDWWGVFPMPNSKSLIFARYQIIPSPPKVGQRVQFFSDVIQDLKVSLELEILYRVAKVGSISARATMTIKTLVKPWLLFLQQMRCFCA